jgi:NAD(P)-dependent dehydrogenase (short-subunit alcohol dehydrogenase family)
MKSAAEGAVIMQNLVDRVAIVTGASSGIGRATAELLAARGASVVLAARREDEIAELADEIQSNGGKASHIGTDIAEADQVVQMVAYAIETYGRLDIAVNNAGYEGEWMPIVDMPDETWDKVLNVNLRGNFLCIKHEAKAMLKAGNGGSIVNVGSVNSFLGCASLAHYSASKHGQIGLTSSASAELAPQGIRVNLVCPGFVDTSMHHRGRAMLGDEIYDGLLSQSVHLGRAGTPIELAKSIAFLCSDEAGYVTGTTLTPDGGYTLTM